MDIKEAQSDMQKAYYNGAPGILASGLIWILAGIIALKHTQQFSVLFFFLGGMVIHPIGIILSKALGRSGKHKKRNPMAILALESTLLLFIGLFIAYALLKTHSNWFFPVMLLIIGVRYVIFNSIYGMRIYWFLGLILVIAGIIFFFINKYFYAGALIGGSIELVFAFIIYFRYKAIE